MLSDFANTNSLPTSLTLSKGPTATCKKGWCRIHNKVWTKGLLEHLLHFYVVHKLLAWAPTVPCSCAHCSLHLLWLQLPVAACFSLEVLLRTMKQGGPVSTGAHLHKQKKAKVWQNHTSEHQLDNKLGHLQAAPLGSLCRQYDPWQLQWYNLLLGYTYCNVRQRRG